MGANSKSLVLIVVMIIAVALIVYGGFMLLSPSYRDRAKRPKRKYQGRPIVLSRLGSFDLEPGKGISYEESGQLYSSFPSGQNPNLRGHYDQSVESEPDPQGEADFFGMFME